MPFRFEGALFGTSGIAGVNRRYWLQLQRPLLTPNGPRRFDLWLEPQEAPRVNTFDLDVLEHLVAAGAPPKPHQTLNPGICKGCPPKMSYPIGMAKTEL